MCKTIGACYWCGILSSDKELTDVQVAAAEGHGGCSATMQSRGSRKAEISGGGQLEDGGEQFIGAEVR